MRIGGIAKQTDFVKSLDGENLKLLKQLYVKILHGDISKFQIYFQRRYLSIQVFFM